MPWQQVALWGGVAIGGLAILATAFISHDLRAERRLYWGGWLAVAGFALIGLWDQGWGGRILIPGGCLAVALLRAWASTPYLKVGDRIYAASELHVQAETPEHLRQPLGPSAYSGHIRAETAWWLFAATAAAIGVWVYDQGLTTEPAIGIAALTIMATLMGIDDATRGLPMVRGQRVQGFVILVASIPMFAVPPVAYVIGYHLGRRRPMGRGRRSGN
jgi:hypothetical protein